MPVDFLSRFTASRQFQEVFQEGMGLIEETANYLDGDGRKDVRSLDKQGSITYASQSMRLTTRLMQLASWLLLQRAISSGEISRAEAEQEKGRICLDDIGETSPVSNEDAMPQVLRDLVARSLRLHERIVTLDVMILEQDETLLTGEAANEVSTHIDMIQKAFNARRT